MISRPRKKKSPRFTRSLLAWVEPDLHRRLVEAAGKRSQTLSGLIRYVLAEWLDRQELG